MIAIANYANIPRPTYTGLAFSIVKRIYMKKPKPCKYHDYDNPVRAGRADLRCRKCGKDITLELVLMQEVEEGVEWSRNNSA